MSHVIRGRLAASSVEVNSQITDLAQHQTGGTSISVEIHATSAHERNTLASELAVEGLGSHDQLLDEIVEHEARLLAWLGASRENVELFVNDPLRALRAAGARLSANARADLDSLTQALIRRGR